MEFIFFWIVNINHINSSGKKEEFIYLRTQQPNLKKVVCSSIITTLSSPSLPKYQFIHNSADQHLKIKTTNVYLYIDLCLILYLCNCKQKPSKKIWNLPLNPSLQPFLLPLHLRNFVYPRLDLVKMVSSSDGTNLSSSSKCSTFLKFEFV